MPARPKATKASPVAKTARSRPLRQSSGGLFERLRAEAVKSLPPIEPYIIRDVDPPISIAPPSSTEQQIALANLFTRTGEFQVRDARNVLEAICGETFPRVWDLVRKEHINVLVAFIQDMSEHFSGELPDEGDFPGGSEASST
jgi:hypothetical protein